MRTPSWILAGALLIVLPLWADDVVPTAPEAPVATEVETDRPPDEPELVDDSRLLVGPTGRPLRKGSGYVSDHFLFLPGVSYGVTDDISLSGGVSLVPGTGEDGQLFYVSPRIGRRFSNRVAVSAGLLYVRVPWGPRAPEHGGLGYVVGTLGGPGGSLTAGVGLIRGSQAWVHAPILMLGGEKRLSKHVALVAEGWWQPASGSALRPVGVATRLSRGPLSADLGVMVAPATPPLLPWVSVSYHFGRKRKGD